MHMTLIFFFSVFVSFIHIILTFNRGGNIFKPEFLRSKKCYFAVKIVPGSGT